MLLALLITYNSTHTQNIKILESFHSIESSIEGSISIIKSKHFKVEVSDYNENTPPIEWKVINQKLWITCTAELKESDNVHVKIYMPIIQALKATQKSEVTIDSTFSTINALSIIAMNGAVVDVGNTTINSLIIHKDLESNIEYISVNTLINNSTPFKH